MERPCMEPEELRLWREQADYIRAGWSAANTIDPCFDCTLAFSHEMRLVGRCNGTPGEAIATAPLRPISERRREANRLAARRWRERNAARRRGLGWAVG